MKESLDAETAQRIDRLIAAFRVQILRALMRESGGEVVARARVVRGQLAQDSHVEPPREYPLRRPAQEGISEDGCLKSESTPTGRNP